MFRNRLIFISCVLLLTSALPTRQVSAVTGTYQDFDVAGVGTPYSEGIHVLPPTPTQGPQLVDGGPTDIGKRMRLAFADAPIPTNNSIAFDRTDVGAFDQVVAEFDFRMSPGNGRADGIGFAFLNTDDYFTTGPVSPQSPLFAAEEPNFAGSLGVGFDIHKSDSPTEVSNNHLSVHFNGTLLQEFDVTDALDLDLASSQWIHASIIMRPGGGYSDVTVILTQCGRAPITAIDQFKVSSFTPYEGRVYFAARSGFESADQDIDNVHVNFLSLEQGVIAFNNNCYTAVEADGSQLLTITRTGSINEAATVNYVTTDHLATAPSDYTAISGTLTFNAGETTKTLSVPILDTINNEPDESFLVSLSDPSTGSSLGGPAVAKVTIVDGETARVEGHWSEVIRSEVVPIHMHLLPTGQVMYWDRHNHMLGFDGNPRLWDPTTGTISMTEMTTYDLFCSGHAFMADGRLLVTGGHIEDGVGENKASIYDPFTDSWGSIPNMNAGRWYPSNVTLENGDIMVLGGTDETAQLNTLPQIWQVANSTWRNLSSAQISKPPFADYYPFLYLAPNGKVFNAGPQKNTYYLDTAGTGEWTYVDDSSLKYRNYGSSVMYEDGKVLIVGGSEDADEEVWTPTASAEVINLNDTNPPPAWRIVAPMHSPRRQLNTTLLPDGKVLVTGGSSDTGFDEASGAVMEAEMWDPSTETWTVMAGQTRYRGYHSNALLLPDGRVLVGGGGHPPDDGAEYNFEIYSPPYLFKGSRPIITDIPELVGYGDDFFIETPDGAAINDVTLVRISSVTHSFNQNQRFKGLDFVQASRGLTATIPANPNLLPPGYYMLFILNSDGIPSVANFIRVDSDVQVSIERDQVESYVFDSSELVSDRFGINGGPVHVKSTKGLPIFTSQRAVFGSSFNSIVGYPEDQLTTDYWFTSYDDAGMITFLVIGNPDETQTAEVDVYIAGTLRGHYSIAPGERVFPRYGINGGPVHVVSTNSVPIFTSERTKFGNSFNEVMGYPGDQLTTEYWFTSYDDAGMITYLVIGNPHSTNTAEVDVYIGGMLKGSYSIGPGQRVFPRYSVNGGPVRVVSTNGMNIFTSERTKFGNTFNEVMGYSGDQVHTEFWFTSYDDTSMITYLVIGNPHASQTAQVDVYIGGVKKNITPYSIGPGQRIFPRYAINEGPVHVVSTNGVNVFASERSKFGQSFNEILGIADNQLTTDYWFTSYDDVGMNTFLVIGAP